MTSRNMPFWHILVHHRRIDVAGHDRKELDVLGRRCAAARRVVADAGFIVGLIDRDNLQSWVLLWLISLFPMGFRLIGA